MLFSILDVTCALKNLQGGIYLNREVVEAVAELIDVELESVPISRAHTYLIIIGQMFVNLSDVVFVWEAVAYALHQLALVAVVVKQYGISLKTVAASTTSFLKIGFDAVGAVNVNYHAHIRLVNTHTKGVGGYHYSILVVLPGLLALVFLAGIKSCMIEGSAYACLFDEFGIFLCTASAASVDNSRALGAAQNMEQFADFIFGLTHNVCQILALKAHLKGIEIRFLIIQSDFNILYHLWCCSCCKCQNGRIRNKFADISYLQIRGTEVIAPLRNAVSLIDSDKTNLHVSKLSLKQF